MTLDPLLSAAGVIPTHALIAIGCFFLGGLQLLAPKGTVLHRIMGRIWVVSMAIVAISSFFIPTVFFGIGPFGPIHLLSVITLVSLTQAIRAARMGNIQQHKTIMRQVYIYTLIIAGAFTFIPPRIMSQVIGIG